jgi:aspartyl-tRNA(Asn)/glutamyl-tRNA(Gln) amidotransferase subunit C
MYDHGAARSCSYNHGMAARITREDAARIAALAKLEMSEAELDRAAREIGTILDHFAALESVDVSDVESVDVSDVEAADATGAAVSGLRADEPAPSLPPRDTFANAPDADTGAGLFRVPRVLGS